MSNLGVTHIIIRRKTYCGSVSLKSCIGAGLQHLIKDRGISGCDSITKTGLAESDSVHYDQNYLFSVIHFNLHKTLR